MKLCILAIACTMGIICTSPTSVIAATTEATIQAEDSADQKDKKAAFDEMMEKAEEKWNSLSDKQKNEVYALIQDQMKDEIKVMNKLVKLGVISQEEADNFKANMMDRFEKMKENSEFPFFRPKSNRKYK